MIQEKCAICGMNDFQTYRLYEQHYKHKHNITMESGVPRLDLSRFLDSHKQYQPMQLEKKQQIVETIETKLRLMAWDRLALNPLVGEDKYTVEPIWNNERNTI